MIARAATLLREILGAKCVVCGFTARTHGLCSFCPDQLPRLHPPLCAVCAQPVMTTSLCGRCVRFPPHYDHVIAAHEYAFPVDAMLRALKYQGNLSIARALGALLGEAVRDAERPDLIVPMPLARARQRQRGFNQTIEITRAMPIGLRAQRVAHVLERVTDTSAQTKLTLTERERNLRNAFRTRAGVKGKRVAIVDDVMTTGATLNEAARALKDAGAIHVSGWVVARTVNYQRK